MIAPARTPGIGDQPGAGAALAPDVIKLKRVSENNGGANDPGSPDRLTGTAFRRSGVIF